MCLTFCGVFFFFFFFVPARDGAIPGQSHMTRGGIAGWVSAGLRLFFPFKARTSFTCSIICYFLIVVSLCRLLAAVVATWTQERLSPSPELSTDRTSWCRAADCRVELLVDATDARLSEDDSGDRVSGSPHQMVTCLILYMFLNSEFFFDTVPVHIWRKPFYFSGRFLF